MRKSSPCIAEERPSLQNDRDLELKSTPLIESELWKASNNEYVHVVFHPKAVQASGWRWQISCNGSNRRNSNSSCVEKFVVNGYAVHPATRYWYNLETGNRRQRSQQLNQQPKNRIVIFAFVEPFSILLQKRTNRETHWQQNSGKIGAKNVFVLFNIIFTNIRKTKLNMPIAQNNWFTDCNT